MAYEVPGLTDEQTIEAIALAYGVDREKAGWMLKRERGEIGGDREDALPEFLARKEAEREQGAAEAA